MKRIIALLLCAVLVACADDQAPLTAGAVEVSLPRPGTTMGVAYLTITNTTAEAITITAVSSPQFGTVEVHETTTEDGVSRMRKLESVTIPAAGSVAFERGGKHLMLMRPLAETGAVTLTFHAGATPLLTVNVTGPE